MKKLSLIIGSCLLMFTISGCVNEGTSITLLGVASPADCNAGESAKMILEGLLDQNNNKYYAFLNVTNNMTEDSAWSSSSSSSSSGSTFEPTLPSMNTVYLEQLTVTCKAIDGSKDACKGMDSIKSSLGSYPLRAGGSALTGAIISLSDWPFSESVEMEMQVKYHDSGVFSDESNTISFTIKRSEISFDEYVAAKGCSSMTPSNSCAIYGQDSPADSSAWTCEEESDDGGDEEEPPVDEG